MEIIKDKLKVEDMVFLKTYHSDLVKLFCPFCRSEISRATMCLELDQTQELHDGSISGILDYDVHYKTNKTLKFECLHCGGKMKIDADNLEKLII